MTILVHVCLCEIQWSFYGTRLIKYFFQNIAMEPIFEQIYSEQEVEWLTKEFPLLRDQKLGNFQLYY